MHAIWMPPRWTLVAFMTVLFFVLVLASAPAVNMTSLDLSFGGGAPQPVEPAPAPVVSEGFDLRDPLTSPLEPLTRP